MALTHATMMNTKDLLRIAAGLGLTARQLDTAAVRAINDTARHARGKTRKAVRAYLTLPANSVNSRVDVSEKAKRGSLTAKVSIGRAGDKRANPRPTLLSYKGKPKHPRSEAKRTKRGKLTKSARAAFSYQITKAGARKTFKKAFVQRRRDGANNVQAFVRGGEARYPLVVPRGPSVSAVWQASDQNNVAEPVLKDTNQHLPHETQRQSQLILRKAFPGK